MDKDTLINKVRNCCPDLDMDSQYPNLFGKYGMSIVGIGNSWKWYEEDTITDVARSHGHHPLTDATDEELWQMLAIVSEYWLSCYKKWYEVSKVKSEKLDRFIGQCERKYFGYDPDGYTDKTIDRVFNAIFEELDSK